MKKYNCELNSILMFVAYSGLPQSQEKKRQKSGKNGGFRKKSQDVLYWDELNIKVYHH